ncbi:UNVERIFIED_CONTAM: hypothetical protein GTU68_019081, partial [Idotea baltica]|nr:hypothetical protein [Idotea baltica]
MFTGIITDIGRISEVSHENQAMQARIQTSYDMEDVAIGASIACDGVCLTVTKGANDTDSNWFEVDISAETISVTNLKSWQEKSEINLERSMKIGDEIGGHLVSGHVDGLAQVSDIKSDGSNTVMTFEIPRELARFIPAKGSVCINGTSFTVNTVSQTQFSINIVPHTMNVT